MIILKAISRACTIYSLVMTILLTSQLQAQDKHEVGEIYPFRKEIRKCHISFSSKLDENSQPQNRINTAVSAYLSEHSPNNLRKSMKKMLKEHGPEYFEEGYLYITGVTMGEKNKTLAEIQEVLDEFNLSERQVVVMEVPMELSESPDLSERSKKLLQETKFFFYSKNLDYEAPIPSEIIAGVIGALAVEIPSAMFMLKTFEHTLDAAVTLSIHASVLLGITIYNKSIANWFLRKSFGNHGDMLKQAIPSTVFVLNFNIGHNFTALINYFENLQTSNQLSADLPGVLTVFALTQGLTVIVQLFFYRKVMTDRIMGWVSKQKDPLARSMEHGVKAIYAIPDAILLFIAGANLFPIWESGLFTLSWGHVGIAGLTAVGWGLTRTSILDWKLRQYKKLFGVSTKVTHRIKSLFQRSKQK